MIRFLLTIVLPMLAPTLLYLFYVWVVRQRGGEPKLLREGPWVWLLLAGVALMLASMITFAVVTERIAPGISGAALRSFVG